MMPPGRALPRARVAVLAGIFAAPAVAGYFFGRAYMGTGWGVGWRTSQFFFNYQQLGFVKRGLVGTLLHPFPALLRPGFFALLSGAWVLAFVVAWARRVAEVWPGLDRISARWLVILGAASPAIFLRQGFDLGRFDVLGLLAMMASISALERARWWLAGAMGAVALLAHEAYLVINFPLVLACAFVPATSSEHAPCGDAAARGSPGRWLALLAPVLVAAVAVSRFGNYEAGQAALERFYAQQPLYLAAKGGQVDGDALSVITRDTHETLAYVARLFWEKRAWLHLPLILAWGALATAYVWRFYRANGLRPGLRFEACFPALALGAVGSDYYRWVALVVTNLFFVMLLELRALLARGLKPVVPGGPLAWALAATALLGPISNTKSFPLVFLALEKIRPGLPW
jgi:hypothetical protein